MMVMANFYPSKRRIHRSMFPVMLSLACLSVIISPVYSFRGNSLAHPLAFRVGERYVIARHVASSPTMESDMDSNIKELESLRRMKQSDSFVSNAESGENDKHAQPNGNAPKPSLKSILEKGIGELSTSNLNSLCNSIRYHRNGMAFQDLKVLERILVELDHQNHANGGTSENLKSIHVFSLLKALSSDIRSLKQKQARSRKNQKGTKRRKISARDVQRLVNVVTLLKKHRNALHQGCYSKDVPSFATMIAAEASRWEPAAVDASLLFLDMVEEEESQDVDWDPRLIGAVLDSLASAGRAEDAQALLGRALGIDIPNYTWGDGFKTVTSSDSSSSKRLNPSQAGACYNAVLRAWSVKATLSAALAKPSMEQARKLLLNHLPFQPELEITNRTCTAVMAGYSSLGIGEGAGTMLMELEALLSPHHSSSLKPSAMESLSSSLDVVCYNNALHAYSLSHDSCDVSAAEKIFASMKDQTPLKLSVKDNGVSSIEEDASDEELSTVSTLSVVPPQPDIISYGTMLNCYSRHGSVTKAEALLEEMHLKNITANVHCYLPVIQALEASNDADAPERVMKWIERSKQVLPRPNRLIYVTALRCMMKSGCGEQAEAVLDKFKSAIPRRGSPDVYSYTLVLRAWEKTKKDSDRDHAAKRAREFLGKMELLSNQDSYPLPRLDANAYNIVLNCYARIGDVKEANNLLTEMESKSIKANGKSYSNIIKAWANSDARDAVDGAWQVLYGLGFPSMEKLTKSVSHPINATIGNINSMLMLLAKRGMASEAEALLNRVDELIVQGKYNGSPDISSYEAVLEALGRCGDTDAPSRAEALVTRMEVMSELGADFQPSLLAYNLLLNVYANAGMAGKAERLLDRLNDEIDVSPDSFSLGTTIKSIANSGKSQHVAIQRSESLGAGGNEVIYLHRLKLFSKWGLGEEAEQLINQMKEQQLDPSRIHYTAVINAWARSKDADATSRAEALFNTVEESFDLDRAAYNSLLLTYSIRGDSSKARRTLQKLLDSDVKPNRNSFTMVIDSYHRSGSKLAGEKAVELLDQMRALQAAGNKDVEPDSIAYASVIRCKQACGNTEIDDMTEYEKMKLMQDLQIEDWPFP